MRAALVPFFLTLASAQAEEVSSHPEEFPAREHTVQLGHMCELIPAATLTFSLLVENGSPEPIGAGGIGAVFACRINHAWKLVPGVGLAISTRGVVTVGGDFFAFNHLTSLFSVGIGTGFDVGFTNGTSLAGFLGVAGKFNLRLHDLIVVAGYLAEWHITVPPGEDSAHPLANGAFLRLIAEFK